MKPAELHQRVRDGINAGNVNALVDLYEADAVLLSEDGASVMGTEKIRAAYEAVVALWGSLELETRYVVEGGDLAMLSNEYTFTVPGCSTTWITAEVARRQSDGSWRYLIDNPYAAPVATV